VLGWDGDLGVLEQFLDLWSLRSPNLVDVLLEELTRSVLGVLEAIEGLLALNGDLVGSLIAWKSTV